MPRSPMFFPVLLVGLIGLASGKAQMLSVVLIVVGLAGVLGLAALDGLRDSGMRSHLAGQRKRDRGPGDDGRRSV